MSRNETWKEEYYADTLLECFPSYKCTVELLEIYLRGNIPLTNGTLQLDCQQNMRRMH